jgi:small-conductance mechanosensitive channel
MLRRTSSALLLTVALATAAPAAAGAAGPGPAEAMPSHEEWVRLKSARVLSLSASRGGADAARRARDASAALAAAAAAGGEVAVEAGEREATLRVGASTILVLGAEDAAAARVASAESLAREAAPRMTAALRSERRRLAAQEAVFSVSLLVASALVVFLVARRLTRVAAALATRLRGHRLVADGIRVAGAEVASPGATHGAAYLATQLGLRLVQAALAYAWVLFALSLFPGTRGAVARLAGAVFDPALALLVRLGRAVPTGVALLLATAALAFAVRAGRIVLESVARGESHLPLVPRDLARPAGALLALAAALVALFFAGPFLGETTGPLAWISIAAVVAAALAAAPLVAGALAGVPLVFGRAVRVGDQVEAEGRSGRVVAISLLALVLEDEAGARVRVPFLALAVRPVRVLPREPRGTVELLVDAGADPVAVEAALRAGTGPGARAELVGVDAGAARWRVSGPRDGLGVRALAALRHAGLPLAAPPPPRSGP